MPKLVDHDARRRSIVAATWRVIARRGLDGVNMRDIAAEAGYSNGAVGYYFAGKDEILRMSFEHVLHETNDRIRASIQGLTGARALRCMCREIMPMASETRLEARIAIALWQRALNDAELAEVNNAALDRWGLQMTRFWQDAIDDGELPEVDVRAHVAVLITMLVGLQVTVALGHEGEQSDEQMALVDTLIGYTAD